ncbi:UTP--glucose-1-phosphate uridylyltransferase GalU [Bdellovibrio bacteriovorus]|uniref:UTP--glucose-1-phosphate uridylyltransferase n=2 Tax=Bdellovibrio bacteriovorus TaxID=959 RepID=Q6MGZ2_BDEBA|nr:UTP--glucose-1-phosphate uridylyltransferase GalU [Bdellovibrio bacteriovorus]ASD62202.1 UTP--glucose-1-phosphate uridylyltransferase [Bdellovibrio bacteriovorus]CAE81135.1 UTP-glucose-1-phosphate uridylyltransferase [Bdellovibrio bacteriovorus HD100]
MPRVKKAIIPAAGLGTRFLPATKTVPKEMLTIVDAPIILYVVEEAVKAGIEDIILIAGRGKHAIEDFFDTSYELEDKLAKDGKEKLLERVTRIRDSANIISIRQKQAMGLGHAVLCGLPIVGKEPFAVLLGDEITMGFHGEPNVTSQLVSSFEETGTSTISVMKVEDKDVSKYGIAEIEEKSTGFFKVTSLVEKPKASETNSRWALPGRYVFDNAIMDILQNAKPTLNGEIQLTDSMKVLCAQHGLNAMTFTAQRFDAGDKLGYLQANIELALQSPELNQELKSYILSLAEKLK